MISMDLCLFCARASFRPRIEKAYLSVPFASSHFLLILTEGGELHVHKRVGRVYCQVSGQ
jgi:hypothetical protein